MSDYLEGASYDNGIFKKSATKMYSFPDKKTKKNN